MTDKEKLIYKNISLQKENGKLRQKLQIAISYVRTIAKPEDYKELLDSLSKYNNLD